MVCAGRRQVAISMRTLSVDVFPVASPNRYKNLFCSCYNSTQFYCSEGELYSTRQKYQLMPNATFLELPGLHHYPHKFSSHILHWYPPPQLIDTLALQIVLTTANYGASFLCSPVTGKFSPIPLFVYGTLFTSTDARMSQCWREPTAHDSFFVSSSVRPGIEIR